MHTSHYDPKKHHRRSIRLKGYDYSQLGAYFITICTRGRECLLGEIINDEMKLNELGIIVWEIWLSLPKRYPQIQLGPAVVMPNHFHAIIEIPAFECEPSVGGVQGALRGMNSPSANWNATSMTPKPAAK